MLHVKGYDNGFCFMIDDKAVSVHEALLANGKKFHKNTINALNRRNISNEKDLEIFERQATVLHTGLSAESARTCLLQNFGVDVFGTEYYQLRSREVDALKKVYAISTYKLKVKKPVHSPMYYFHRYLSTH